MALPPGVHVAAERAGLPGEPDLAALLREVRPLSDEPDPTLERLLAAPPRARPGDLLFIDREADGRWDEVAVLLDGALDARARLVVRDLALRPLGQLPAGARVGLRR